MTASQGAKASWRVSITQLDGKVIVEYCSHRASRAKNHFNIFVQEKKYKPSLITLIDEDGLVKETCFVHADG